MWEIKEYELGKKSRIRLWAIKNKLAISGGSMIIIMEEGELMFFVKEGVGKIPFLGNIEERGR